MQVRDKQLKKNVDVSDKDCPKRWCYSPCEWKGTITPGVGYNYAPKSMWRWTCLHRDNHGCPHPKPEPGAPRGGKTG